MVGRIKALSMDSLCPVLSSSLISTAIGHAVPLIVPFLVQLIVERLADQPIWVRHSQRALLIYGDSSSCCSTFLVVF